MRLSVSLLFLLCCSIAYSQSSFLDGPFQNARVLVDTSEFEWNDFNNDQLSFSYDEDNEVAEIFLEFRRGESLDKISILPSADFSIIDSIIVVSNYARFKVQFTNLTNSDFLKFLIEVSSDSTAEIVELPLFPFTDTYADIYPNEAETYIGEERAFEVVTNNVDNIKADNRWTESEPINYRTSKAGGELTIHTLPNTLGRQVLSVPLNLKKPFLKNGEFHYQLPAITKNFLVQAGRLTFLQFDKSEVTPNDDRSVAIEVQLDNSRSLSMNKTYRIEDQEEAGGPLIAELYTKTLLNNDRVLCLLRPYTYHRKTEGYLYIKDGDQPRFVTNIDITPKTEISGVFIQRNGKDYEKSNVVYPGETVNIKLEGEALHKANFSFPGANNLTYDSLVRNEKVSVFRLKIPLDIGVKRIEIFNNKESTGTSLRVEEFQKPRSFDFITLDLGAEEYVVSEIDKPIYYDGTITDLVFDFDRNMLDLQNDLNGKQYLTINVRLSNKKGSLVELYQFEELVICPSESSPRSIYYDSEDCKSDDINLNNFLRNKTSELEEWSRIEIEIAHDKTEHSGSGKKKKIQIILRREYNFDIDVSFPAGLLILKGGQGEGDFSNFGGVSFAMLAQFSFYQPGKIAKYQPYKIGAGFIAIDAFNFNSDVDRQDIGLVVIGSLYPISSDNKLSFPLYLGGGYLLKDKKPFILVGPGIRVRI